MGRLTGKVAVVTGGARGVGLGHAKLLAAEGASVVVNDLGGEWDGNGTDERAAQLAVDEIVAAGGTAVANFDDVADWEGAQRLINQAIDTFGDLDILILNAGILRDRMTFNMSAEEWDAVIRVHLRGHFLPVRWAAAYWREETKRRGEPHGGRVILTSSESGLYGNGGQINYAAAKMGIASMGIVLSRELARSGVTSNIIAPRARTRLTENTFGAFNTAEGEFDQWDPDNVAPWVVWLCTDAASHITGQCFVVGGGLVELVQMPAPVSKIRKNGRWELDELDDKAKELFGDRPTTPRRMVAAESMPTGPA
ncbi:MAG: SDR family NAD(P)-dependent oxidoreductase [Acidimicrobiales bacterium]